MPVSINGVMHGYKVSLRALLGMKGHRPSAFNMRVGQCMRQSGVTPAGGGRYSEPFQRQFIRCAEQAGARIGSAGRRRAGA